MNLCTKAVITGAAVLALATAAPAGAEPQPSGPGVGVCSFQGQQFVQYYWCTKPPSWLFQPGISSADAVPGVGTATSPYS